MSTTVNEAKTIKLIDGSEIAVRPLRISLLRDFMKRFEEIAKVADDNDQSMNVLMECVQIAMRQYKPEVADDIKALEDLLDLPTVYAIVEAASGVNLGATPLLGQVTN
jgi:inhibitor of KinA sporulation pathway (predicted exonuclease)